MNTEQVITLYPRAMGNILPSEIEATARHKREQQTSIRPHERTLIVIHVKPIADQTLPAHPLNRNMSAFVVFKGTGDIKDLDDNEVNTLEVTGHVGFSLNDGETIYGFGPITDPSKTRLETITALGRRHVFPGKLSDDTHVFQSVAKKAVTPENLFRENTLGRVMKKDISISPSQYAEINTRVQRILNHEEA